MRLLQDILVSDVAVRVGWTLLHTLWMGAAAGIAFAAAVLALRHRSANARYLAGCAALAMMVVLAVVVFCFVPGPAGSIPPPSHHLAADGSPPAEADRTPVTGEPVPRSTLPEADAAAQPGTSVRGGREVAPPAASRGPEHSGETAASALPPENTPAGVPPVVAPTPLLQRLSEALEPALPWVALGWAVGVVLLSSWQLAGWMTAQHLKRCATLPAQPSILAGAAALARSFGVTRPVRILHSLLVRVPTVLGWLKPVVLLPTTALTGLTPEQLRAILAHELAHIRRHDYLVNLLQSVVETLFFYHPAVWFISRRVRIERENCCDDLAVAAGVERLSYAESLLHVACQSLPAGPGRSPAAALLATGRQKPSRLRRRIRRLLGGQEDTNRLSGSWPIAFLLLVGLGAASLWLSGGADAARSDPSAPHTASPSKVDIGLDRVKIEANPPDKLPGGLYAIGPYELPRGQAPDAHGLYVLRMENKIGDGHEQLVGRLPVNLYGLGTKGGAILEVTGLTREGSRILATLRYTAPLEGAKLPAFSVYIRAWLPKLPPGQYEARLEFEEHFQTGDGKLLPVPNGQRPQIRPMACTFRVPGSPPATQPAAAAQATDARIAGLIRQLGSDEHAERDAAQKALVAIGRPATAALEAAGGDKDPERAARAQAALRQIKDRFALKQETWRNRWEQMSVSFRLTTPSGRDGSMSLDVDPQGKAVAEMWEPRREKLVRYESVLSRKDLDAAALRLGQQRPWEWPDAPKLPPGDGGTISVTIAVEEKTAHVEQPWPTPKDLPRTQQNEQLLSALMAVRNEMTHLIQVVRRDAAIRAQGGTVQGGTEGKDASSAEPGGERTAIREVLDLLDLPWQTTLTATQLDEAAASIRAQGDEAVGAILKQYNATNSNAFRHRAVQVFQRLATAKARAALLDIALRRTADDLPSSHAWAARAYLEAITDKADARKLLASDDSGVLNPVLLAMKGLPVDETLLKRIGQIIRRKDEHPADWSTLRLAAARVLSADARAVLLDERVDLLVAVLSDVAKMPERDKTGWHGYMTHGEMAYNALLNALREMPAEAGPLLAKASAARSGAERDILIAARAFRGDIAVRKDIHAILADGQAGLRRAWAARALGVIGTDDDLPLLKRLAEADPLARERGGDVGPPGFRQMKFYPVRDAAKDGIRAIEGKTEPGPGGQPATQPAPTGKAPFDTLTVEITSNWLWNRTISIQADGTYVFDLEQLKQVPGKAHMQPDEKHYIARHRLQPHHLRRLEELLGATKWLVTPGKVNPRMEDGTKYALTLVRGGRETSTVCYGDQDQPHNDLIQFLRRIDAQEWLLYQMTPDAQYRHNPVAELDDELDAVLGKPGKTPPYAPVLDYERVLPGLESLLARGTWKEQEQVQDVIRKIDEWRKSRPATRPAAMDDDRALRRLQGTLAADLSNEPAAAEKAPSSAWSKPAGGLAGRLTVANDRIHSGGLIDGFFEVFLELKNVEKTPVAVQADNPFAFDMKVSDEQGAEVKPTWTRSDILTPPLRWVVIAPGAARRFKISTETNDGAKGANLDTTTEIWKLPPGKYRLTATYSSKGFFQSPGDKPPPAAWKGEIALGPLAVEVGQAGDPTRKEAEPLDSQTLDLIDRLQRNPWADWPAGTEVVRQFLDDGKPAQNVQGYVQPDITYKVLEKDRLLIRTQQVNGKPAVQDFRVQDQTGMPGPHLTGQGAAVDLPVDGANVRCLLYESKLDVIGADFGGAVVTKQWVLTSRPTVLLRRESGENWWAITSVRARRRIGQREYLCIETRGRLAISGGHVVTTRYLHPDVPGHLVEEIKEFYKDVNGQPQRVLWMITHERTAAVRAAPAATTVPAKAGPGQGRTEGAPASLAIDVDASQPADTPVILTARLTNTSDKDIQDDFESPLSFRAFLTGPDGQARRVAVTNGAQIEGSFGVSPTLKPGQSVATPLRLTNYPAPDWRRVLFSEQVYLPPGKYQLRLERLLPGPNPTGQLMAKSTVSFTVVRDANLAKARLAELQHPPKGRERFCKHVLEATLTPEIRRQWYADIKDHDPKKAVWKVYTLCSIEDPPPDVMPAIVEALKVHVKSPNVADHDLHGLLNAAAMAIGRYRPAGAGPAMLALATGKFDASDRGLAIWALRHYYQPDMADRIAALLGDKAPWIALHAASLLAWAGDARGADVLIAAAKAGNPSAAAALAYLPNHQAAAAAMRAALASKDEQFVGKLKLLISQQAAGTVLQPVPGKSVAYVGGEWLVVYLVADEAVLRLEIPLGAERAEGGLAVSVAAGKARATFAHGKDVWKYFRPGGAVPPPPPPPLPPPSPPSPPPYREESAASGSFTCVDVPARKTWPYHGKTKTTIKDVQLAFPSGRVTVPGPLTFVLQPFPP